MHNEKENVKQGQNILGGYHTGCNPIFCIQYTSNDQRCDLQFYQIIKDTELTIMSGSGTMQICLRIPAWEKAICLRLNMHWRELYW
ncbi:hypothetical protein BLAHAN_04454 [Blautia hansenii DSM 20583]|uniref:Uncharacterized protein n=1 Tax=Blautia hansenii DSM 20583 TaxID=537007 RepID=C9L504_BLAHA|nr:hypothetical protein BLAHAN_04454 [Blautia hansenii DSM 20583]